MSYRWSKRSRTNLSECDPRLQDVFNTVITKIDCTITDGYRGKKKQNSLLLHGKTKLRWPNSKHNAMPSLAADVHPYPVDFDNIERYHVLAAIVKAVAHEKGIALEWGGDWSTFKDYCHWQIASPIAVSQL